MFTKLIKYYLKKNLTVHPKHYYFLRWLVNIVEDEKKIDKICCAISRWTLKNVNNGRLFGYIKDVFVIDDIIYIYTDRPGLLIGKAGKTVYELEEEINCNSKIKYKIHFIEMYNVSYTSILTYITIANDY